MSNNVEVEVTPANDGLLIRKRTAARHPVERVYAILDSDSNTDDYIEDIRGR